MKKAYDIWDRIFMDLGRILEPTWRQVGFLNFPGRLFWGVLVPLGAKPQTSPRGPQGPSRDTPGTPQDPPRAPKEPPVSPQDALGPPEVYPRAPQGAPSIIQDRP